MVKKRTLSLTMVVLVLLVILLMQSAISYSTTFGRLDSLTTETRRSLATGWSVFRAVLIMAIVILWIINRKKALLKAIIIANSALTIGLLMNMTALTDVLAGLTTKTAQVLLVGKLL